MSPVAASPIAPQVLSPEDVALYKQIMAAERKGEYARAGKLSAQVSDTSLLAYAEAIHLLSVKRVKVAPLVEWLKDNRELAIADRVYRLAVAHSTKKVRRRRKTIIVALTADSEAADRDKCLNAGMNDYMRKPFSSEQIADMLKKWLG